MRLDEYISLEIVFLFVHLSVPLLPVSRPQCPACHKIQTVSCCGVDCLCVFVNLLVMSMCCAKTDELIKMLFGMWTRERRLGLGNHYYVGPPDRWGHRRRKGSVVGGTMASAEHKPITSGLGAEPTTTNLSYRKQYALLRSMHCHWCQSWGAQSAWCPQPRHWGVMREPAEICPWSIAQPYSLGGGSNAAASLLQQLAYCYATIRDASLTCARKPTSQLNLPHGTDNCCNDKCYTTDMSIG